MRRRVRYPLAVLAFSSRDRVHQTVPRSLCKTFCMTPMLWSPQRKRPPECQTLRSYLHPVGSTLTSFFHCPTCGISSAHRLSRSHTSSYKNDGLEAMGYSDFRD